MKAKLVRGAIQFLDGLLDTETCFVCGEPIREDGISRPIDRPNKGRSEYRRFHDGCWDGE